MKVTASERALAELSFRLVRLLGSGKVAPSIDHEGGTLLAAAVLKEAISAQNPKGYLPLFAPEVSVSTPKVSGILRDRPALAEFLNDLFAPFWEIEFMQTFLAERGAVMRFRACVKGATTDGFMLAEFDGQSRIREFVLTLNTPVARLLPASA